MNSRSYCSPERRARAIRPNLYFILVLACILLAAPSAVAGDAPQWIHAVASAPVPEHDERTDAVLLYSETNVNVISADKVKTVERRVYKILRPDGRDYGIVRVPYNSPWQKITSLRGWCIPAQGKDYEVKDKEAVDISLPKIDGAELISDVRDRLLQIPAADPGNLLGYEYEIEENPLVLQSAWEFQREIPSRESRFSIQLPAGWEYKATFLNYPEVKSTQSAPTQWQWTATNIKGLRPEDDMPPFDRVVGAMIVTFLPPSGAREKVFSNWHEMGLWEWNLEHDRLAASPAIKQKVADLTADKPGVIEKIRAIANFVQNDIRYVAIELGIGGWQPHPAADIFKNRYGDCKDKATLMSAMLHEIGVESLQVATNIERESIPRF
jgi:hypothetical protein